MTCNKCNNRVKRNSKYCYQCGEPVHISPSKESILQLMNKGRKKVFLVAILLVFTITLVCIYTPYFIYKISVYDYHNGKYEKALKGFQAIGTYKESHNFVKVCEIEILYSNALTEFERKNYEKVLLLLIHEKENDKILDLRQKVISEIYNAASINYLKGDFLKAKDGFELIKDYKDIEDEYTKNEYMIKIQGKWVDQDNPIKVIKFDGWHYCWVFDNDDIHRLTTVKFSNNKLLVSMLNYELLLDNEKLIEILDDGQRCIYVRNTNSPSIPSSKRPVSIGMTAQEVENSTWGKPKKINRTTTRYGVSEQWVYSNNRYVYLDDGIVTAIQE